jgi:hypothetical protein
MIEYAAHLRHMIAMNPGHGSEQARDALAGLERVRLRLKQQLEIQEKGYTVLGEFDANGVHYIVTSRYPTW